MFNSIIDVNNSINGNTINVLSPSTITFTLSGYNPPKKIWKIEYTVRDKTIAKTLFLSTDTVPNLPYPSEIGDPRNYPVDFDFFTELPEGENFNVKINIYYIDFIEPETIEFNINTSLPKMENIFSSNFSFELVGTRMFGEQNQLILMFESKQPRFLIPVLLKF
jgi:hypothetical protein